MPLNLGLGKTTLSAPPDQGEGLLSTARSLYREHTPDMVQHAINSGLRIGEWMGLSDPSTMFNEANIASLLTHPALNSEMRTILAKVAQRFPKRANIPTVTNVVTDPIEQWGRRFAGRNVTGTYTPATRTSQIAVNTPGGFPRSTRDILETVGHEEFGHGLEQARAADPAAYSQRRAMEMQMPYSARPREQRARRAGRALVKWAQQNKLIGESTPPPTTAFKDW